MSLSNLDTVFVDVDDFCQTFLSAWEKHLISSGIKQRNKFSRLYVSEVMTIVIAFHQSGYRDFKTYSIHFVCRYLTTKFPELVSYTRMLKLMQCVLVLLCSYLTHREARPTGIAFVDSSKLQVCHNLLILRHQVFKGTAKR
ncbi:Mobile element protein [Candidatus Enterovibrio escicola]|uniref:Mobile element protein n=1 Tax=Candidatus Enterovibrio escicola TaxID=1927127 RepID=A0A2A5T4N8_9GAMM|nr:transposase [Candidatus Enterovibrio escacola]PCS23125.1 Mobile element protein [Candidatus Enterovibrio escacola]